MSLPENEPVEATGASSVLAGPVGVAIAAAVGVGIAVVAAVGVVTAVNQAPAPVDEAYVVYGTTS